LDRVYDRGRNLSIRTAFFCADHEYRSGEQQSPQGSGIETLARIAARARQPLESWLAIVFVLKRRRRAMRNE
jgi:hypothetical protein